MRGGWEECESGGKKDRGERKTGRENNNGGLRKDSVCVCVFM